MAVETRQCHHHRRCQIARLSRRGVAQALACSAVALILAACGVTFERPTGVDLSSVIERAVSEHGDQIRVSASLPTHEESLAIFGVDFQGSGIQPLWLELENQSDQPLWFFPTGLDPEYFSPLEASFALGSGMTRGGKADLDEHFRSLALTRSVAANSQVSGFLFTNQDVGTKVVHVDLVGRRQVRSATLFVSAEDSQTHIYDEIFARQEQTGWVDLSSEDALRRELERLPCCVLDAEGNRSGPVNLILIGKMVDVLPAFIRRNYRYAPVGKRYLFDRPQDVSAGKRDRWVPAQPLRLRLWLMPVRFRGKPVWAGQAVSVVGGRFAETGTGSEPAPLDPAVDWARGDVIQDAIFSQALSRLGFVKAGVALVPDAEGNPPSGERFYTDGLRAVMLFDGGTVSLSEIGNFDWERLADHYRTRDAP